MVTDIATGWTVNRSVKNKVAIWVCEAIDYVAAQFPFPIPGIDTDNGSEFINAHLLADCTEHQITFTRSRSGNKNDGCHVEQKNWNHVRELVDYLRFDTVSELAILNQIWELDQTFTNPWVPSTTSAQLRRPSGTRGRGHPSDRFFVARWGRRHRCAPEPCRARTVDDGRGNGYWLVAADGGSWSARRTPQGLLRGGGDRG